MGPPVWLAGTALVLGVLSVLGSFVLDGAAGWFGWILGFSALLVGIGYRWEVRRRQTEPQFLPNRRIDRLMLLGVLVGAVGIVLNAYDLSQRVVL